MTNREIVDFYYGRRPDLTLQQLATLSGRTVAELCKILFPYKGQA